MAQRQDEPSRDRTAGTASSLKAAVPRSHLWVYWPWYAVLAAMVVLVLSSHFVKAYSDPANWLRFAYHFGSEFRTSRWPLGYPVFLRLASLLLGRFYVFWANLPLLLGILFIAGKLTEKLVRHTGVERAAPWVGLIAMVWPFLLDFPHFVYLVNPYRDPLAILLCMTSVLWMSRLENGNRRPASALGGAGLFLGLAVCVKEPSILLILPMFAYGLQIWRSDASLLFWRSVSWFTLGLVLGVLPFVIETYLHTHSVLIPPQSFEEGRLLPGMHLHVFFTIAGEALEYFWQHGGWSTLIAVVLGVFWAVRQKNRVLLYLVLPAAVVFFIFYSFYWTFSKRYFFIVLVFLSPLLACGTWQACLWLSRLLRVEKMRTRIIALFAGYLAIHSVVAGFLHSALWLGENPGFTVSHARSLIGEIEARIPEDGTFLAPRFLCEVVECFSPIDSYPAYALMTGDLPIEDALKPLIDKVQAGKPVYVGEVLVNGRGDPGTELVRQLYDLEPVQRLSIEEYHLAAVCGSRGGEVLLHRIRPWSQNDVARPFWTEHLDSAFLRVDAGVLWGGVWPGRKKVEMFWDGVSVANELKNGVNYVRLPEPVSKGAHEVRLKSDAPLPARFELEVFAADRAIPLDFRWNAFPLHARFLDPADWRKMPGYEGDYGFVGAGKILLPSLWHEPLMTLAFFSVTPGPLEADIPYRISCWSNDEELGSAEVSAGAGSLLANFGTIQDQKGAIPVSLKVSSSGDAPAPSLGMELEKAVLIPVQPNLEWRVNPGSPDGAWFVREGWHHAERLSPKEPFRWTRGRARMMVVRPQGIDSAILKIRISDRFRVEQAPACDVKLQLDGRPLAYELDTDALKKGWAWLRAELPEAGPEAAGRLSELVIETVPWRPSELTGSRDQRELGVMVADVTISPASDADSSQSAATQ